MDLGKGGWKAIIGVIAVIALGASLYFNWPRPDVPQPDFAYFVDVTDGTVYRTSQKGKTLPYKVKSPSTGERTLFRVSQAEDGNGYKMSTRYIPDDADEIPNFFDIVNPNTGAVTLSNPEVRQLDL